MKPKLILCDLDGTLLTEEKKVSTRTMAALTACKQKGIKIGIATGRPLFTVKNLIVKWGIDTLCDVLVCMNGCQIYDCHTQELHRYELLAGHYMLEIIDLYKDMDVNFGIYEEGVMYTKRFDKISERLQRNNNFKQIVTDFKEECKKDYEKLVVFVTPERMPEVLAFHETILSPHYRGVQTQADLFEYMHPMIDKSYGIGRLCELWHMEMQDVMAFGDNSNDAEMLRDVGCGVCMANGNDEVKALSNAVTASNEEDGIAVFLEEHVLIEA